MSKNRKYRVLVEARRGYIATIDVVAEDDIQATEIAVSRAHEPDVEWTLDSYYPDIKWKRRQEVIE